MEQKIEQILKKFYSQEPKKMNDLSHSILFQIQTKKLQKKKILRFEFASLLIVLGFGFFLWMNGLDEELMETNISFYSSMNKEVKEVEVMGDFNNWKKEKMEFQNGKWNYNVKVKPYTLYKYVFLVDGHMQENQKKGKIKGYFNKFNRILMVFKDSEGAKK